MYKELSACQLCPRNCKINRNSGQKGFCGESAEMRIGRADLHFWEEPCLSGENGSGTVFFSGCPLKCVYCQNYGLSNSQKGKKVSVDELSKIFLELEKRCAHNINLVTAEHFSPMIRDAVTLVRNRGLKIPVVLNSSGYVSDDTLEILKDVIDIYLVDIKYMDNAISKKYSFAENYPEVAKRAIDKMVKLKGEVCFDCKGILKSGVIIRHLCIPGLTEDSKKIMKYIHSTYGEKVLISIMSQYTPMRQCAKYPEINRKLTKQEYDTVIDYCLDIGIEEAYIQDGESASESFIPEFG